MTNASKLRNIAIIAHVDHGKTTLIDTVFQQTLTNTSHGEAKERVMDSNELERERGITILAKNTAIDWKDYRINIVDTPGHADFGGEVERILSMVDSVLLLVDAVEGPMPQTRFVTQKAFAQGLKPIVVINKIDRPSARPDWVIDQVFDLFDNLGATDEQLDFPILYASGLNGWATTDLENPRKDLSPLLNMIIEKVPAPDVDEEGPFQMQISSLDYNAYVGTIGIGRINRGTAKRNMPITLIDAQGKTRKGKLLQVLRYLGLSRQEVESAQAGDIIAISGIEKLNISDTLCDPETVEALPELTVDEPTVTMTFQANDSPFVGQDGKHVTGQKIKTRLEQELLHNVALRVETIGIADKFRVSGRGELHLAILIETMRREGFELAVSRPQVITKEVDGQIQEPFELLTIDLEDAHQGGVMEQLGKRGGLLQNMIPDGHGRTRLEYVIPTRGLIGFRTEFLTLTSGTGLMYHVFDHYGEKKPGELGARLQGVLISNAQGKSTAYALWNLQERGRLYLGPQTAVYEGMIVGLHARDNDLIVNVTKEKQLTNIRAAGTDENILLTPPVKMSLEQAMEFIADDELIEITPTAIRLRKQYLKEVDRKRLSRSKA